MYGQRAAIAGSTNLSLFRHSFRSFPATEFTRHDPVCAHGYQQIDCHRGKFGITSYLRGSGFDGVVFRDIAGPALLECIHSVATGHTYLQAKTGHGIAEEADAVGARVRDRLTPKEIKIVALIVQGFKNKEIASHLGTTEQVIKNYLRNVYDKTGVSDRLELALFLPSIIGRLPTPPP